MKTPFKKYLLLVVVLLLNTFACLQANEVISTITNYVAPQHSSALQYDAENANNQSIDTTTYNPFHNETDDKWFFDLIDSNNLDEEEASTKYKLYYKDNLETAFINALLFESYSKELQKNIYRPKSDINAPKLRLHIQLQVFII